MSVQFTKFIQVSFLLHFSFARLLIFQKFLLLLECAELEFTLFMIKNVEINQINQMLNLFMINQMFIYNAYKTTPNSKKGKTGDLMSLQYIPENGTVLR